MFRGDGDGGATSGRLCDGWALPLGLWRGATLVPASGTGIAILLTAALLWAADRLSSDSNGGTGSVSNGGSGCF